MKTILELELELANAKLAKMTSTVKQLGTKLTKANEENTELSGLISYYEMENLRLRVVENSVRKAVLTRDEAHGQALTSFEFNVTHRNS